MVSPALVAGRRGPPRSPPAVMAPCARPPALVVASSPPCRRRRQGFHFPVPHRSTPQPAWLAQAPEQARPVHRKQETVARGWSSPPSPSRSRAPPSAPPSRAPHTIRRPPQRRPDAHSGLEFRAQRSLTTVPVSSSPTRTRSAPALRYTFSIFGPPHVQRCRRRDHLKEVLGIVERIGLVESLKRLFLRAPLDIPIEPTCCINFRSLPESSRDCRHVGDLRWHGYYRMNLLSETTLPPKRYKNCDPSTGKHCYHEPSPVFQLFDVKLQPALSNMADQVEVYELIAVRDGEDYRRNYLFNRSRDNPVAINVNSDLLRLMSPKRGMSMKFNCLIEVDIRVKAVNEGTEDYTLVDGCMEFVEDRVSFGTFFRCSMTGPNGVAVFDLTMFKFGVEATIELDFLRVPEIGGFEIQMFGYTSHQKSVYTFIDKNRECNSFISSVGKFLHHFVAAVPMNDILFIDFIEGGCPVLFKPAIHGSQTEEYRFLNGAIVSVTVSWSTTYYCA